MSQYEVLDALTASRNIRLRDSCNVYWFNKTEVRAKLPKIEGKRTPKNRYYQMASQTPMNGKWNVESLLYIAKIY